MIKSWSHYPSRLAAYSCCWPMNDPLWVFVSPSCCLVVGSYISRMSFLLVRGTSTLLLCLGPLIMIFITVNSALLLSHHTSLINIIVYHSPPLHVCRPPPCLPAHTHSPTSSSSRPSVLAAHHHSCSSASSPSSSTFIAPATSSSNM